MAGISLVSQVRVMLMVIYIYGLENIRMFKDYANNG